MAVNAGHFKRLPEAEETQRRTLWAQGLCDSDIAERVGSTSQAIQNWRHKRGLQANLKWPRQIRRNPDKFRCQATAEEKREVARFVSVLSLAHRYAKQHGLQLDILRVIEVYALMQGEIRVERGERAS